MGKRRHSGDGNLSRVLETTMILYLVIRHLSNCDIPQEAYMSNSKAEDARKAIKDRTSIQLIRVVDFDNYEPLAF